ncbi:DNA-(apurinic or apyrimidinic site) endonuclease isoform X2 [Galleria mellonella]|uniref:DNA-(apurinic or apyrimidinic site) endonuclease n=1 Tax=Galleria mellonella TaxID=7137 RepID=A0ABM3N540_GALME|nr:DNA-(apurinic or apyrimidinic site) endonuclease isoform X2 [Galleria mellonella]
MAPRTAKTKKTEVKTKGKNIEGPTTNLKDDVDMNGKSAPVIEKTTKRGKRKAANDSSEQEQINNIIEETAQPAKKGKKGVEVETSEEKTVSNDIVENESVSDQNGDTNGEANGGTDEIPTAKGKKRPTKKEQAVEKNADIKPKETVKSRKNTKQEKATSEAIEEGEIEEKPVAKKRGRKPQPKLDEKSKPEESNETVEEEAKSDLPTKDKKKGVKAAAVKENTPDSEKDESQEGKPVEEIKKKETKGRKGLGKKAQVKEEVKEKSENKGDVKETTEEDNADGKAKTVKAKRSTKNKVAETAAPAEEEPQDTGEPKKKKRATAEDTKKKAPPKNKATTDYDSLDFSNSSKNAQGKEWNYKIASWNVDGIRAWLSKGGLDYIQHEKPDILCLQEIKCSQEKLPNEVTNLPGYHAYWLCSDKDGYAGVGIYTTKLAMNVTYGLQNEELDNEGRIITAEYEHFYLICTYVPNAGRNLVTLPKRLQWNEEFRKYVNELDKKKPVIICGDMNVAHNEIDLANPKTNKKNAGFTIEERTGMTDLLGDGFVDTYRHLYPDKTGAYTFWTYMMNSRAKNVGWRLDYFIVSQRFLPSLCDNVIRGGVYGSDHCPISLFLHLSSAEKPK